MSSYGSDPSRYLPDRPLSGFVAVKASPALQSSFSPAEGRNRALQRRNSNTSRRPADHSTRAVGRSIGRLLALLGSQSVRQTVKGSFARRCQPVSAVGVIIRHANCCRMQIMLSTTEKPPLHCPGAEQSPVELGQQGSNCGSSDGIGLEHPS